MADLLSRYPVEETYNEPYLEEIRFLYVEKFNILPVTAKQIAIETSRDPILSRVFHNIQHGWNENTQHPDHIKAYFNRRSELTSEKGCILWGMRIIIPSKLRKGILEELHDSHLGIVKMKSLARQHVWWPNIDANIEDLAGKCSHCIGVRKNPPQSPLHPWEWPTKSWQRIHIDFAGPIENHHLLLIVDSHSKWPEIIPMRSTTAEATITHLKLIFARFGLPERIVSDNGPQFSSNEFRSFTRRNGIRHTFSAPYHPATNGAVENFVGTAKKSIKANMSSGLDLNESIIRFLTKYRTVSHSTTGKSPCELMLGRQNRTRFDLLRPESTSQTVRSHQECQIEYKRGRIREIQPGDFVLARDYRKGKEWQRAIVRSKLGAHTFILETPQGLKLKRHIDQIWLSGPDFKDQLEEDAYRTHTEDRTYTEDRLLLSQLPNPPRDYPEHRISDEVSTTRVKDTEHQSPDPSPELSVVDPPELSSSRADQPVGSPAGSSVKRHPSKATYSFQAFLSNHQATSET